MEDLEFNFPKHVGFFVEKNYFADLHKHFPEDLTPKRLEQHLEDYVEDFLGYLPKAENKADYTLEKHFIACRQVIKSSILAPSQVQDLLADQAIENLFIKGRYTLTHKLIEEGSKELTQALLLNAFTLRVLTAVQNGHYDVICLFVRDKHYVDLLQHLETFADVKVLLFDPRGLEDELMIDNSLCEYADGLITSLDFHNKQTKAVAQTSTQEEEVRPAVTPTIFHNSEDNESSKLGELLGKIKSAPKIEVAQPKYAVKEQKPNFQESHQKVQNNFFEEEDDFNEGEEYIGEVANIVKGKGFGFIKRSPNNVFLYYANMVDAEDFYDLEVGTKVIYKIRRAKGGRIQAYDVYLLEE